MNNQLILSKNSTAEMSVIKSALLSQKIKGATLEELSIAVSSAVDKAIFFLGLKTDVKDRDMIKITVMDDCKQNFPSLTLSEIELAIYNGSRGKYGEVFGLSPSNIFHWLNEFKHDQLRLTAVKELEAANDFDNEPTDAEKEAVAWYNLVNAWHRYKTEGHFVDIGNVVYNILAINGKINFTQEKRDGFKEMAKAQLIASFNPEKHFGNDIKMKEAMKMVMAIKDGNEPQRIIAEAKRIALNEFFAGLLETGTEIEDLFEQDV